MSMNDPNKITSKSSQPGSNGPFLRLLRTATLVSAAVGAIGSLAFMFRAGQDSPRILLVLFTFWILAPFAALLWAVIVPKRWSAVTRATLYWVTIVVAAASVAIYGDLVHVKPAGSPNAFLFVIVPPVSVAFIAIAVGMAALISGRTSRRDAGT